MEQKYHLKASAFSDPFSQAAGRPVHIGIVGTGFISRHFAWSVHDTEGFTVSRVLTRRPIDSCRDHLNHELLTDSLHELLDNSDVLFECSGDPIYATDVVDAACQAGVPVVTMNTELHVTTGSYFVGRGLISETEGDQPGCQAALLKEVLELGFRPLVYGNMKGFQNFAPTLDEMKYWSKRQGTSVSMTTSFTDGTKIQFEQALVANGCGATFAVPGMLGIESDEVRSGAEKLAAAAKELGMPISDYLLSPKLTHGVFIVAEHDEPHHDSLRYYKMGEGPYYTIIRPNIFVHLEVMKTIKRVVREGRILLDNSALPRVSVSTVAKRELEPGAIIKHGIGSFDVRGVGVEISQNAGHLPIGLLSGARLTQRIEAGETLKLADVEIPNSLALRAWQHIERLVLIECGL
jgi:predicted homoserine dehydrogenase-like protein